MEKFKTKSPSKKHFVKHKVKSWYEKDKAGFQKWLRGESSLTSDIVKL